MTPHGSEIRRGGSTRGSGPPRRRRAGLLAGRALLVAVALAWAAAVPGALPAAPPGADGPRPQEAGTPLGRVLVVNDDGIDSPGLLALATAFAEVGRVTVVAPEGERSGSGVTSQITGEHELEATRVELAGGHEAYAVDGYPVDCVLFAVHVVFGGELPDLVVSGINTVPNLGAAAHVSGTLGAARIARQLGVPALAVSGFDADIPGQAGAASRYAVALARSPLFAALGPAEYLTLDVPMVPPGEFRGVRRAPRHLASFVLRFDDPTPPLDVGDRRSYRTPWVRGAAPPPDSDVALFQQNFLIVGVMSVHTPVGEDVPDHATGGGHPLPSLEEALGDRTAPGGR